MPPYDPNIHHRRSIRLKDYDYSQPGAYFVTLCTRHGARLFGDLDGEDMRLNDVGRMVYSLWADIPTAYQPADIDVFVVMPNHLHGIIVVPDKADAHPGIMAGEEEADTKASSVSEEGSISCDMIVRNVKSLAVNRYWGILREAGKSSAHVKLWHRDYYEHVIRS